MRSTLYFNLDVIHSHGWEPFFHLLYYTEVFFNLGRLKIQAVVLLFVLVAVSFVIYILTCKSILHPNLVNLALNLSIQFLFSSIARLFVIGYQFGVWNEKSMTSSARVCTQALTRRLPSWLF